MGISPEYMSHGQWAHFEDKYIERLLSSQVQATGYKCHDLYLLVTTRISCLQTDTTESNSRVSIQ